MKPIVAVWKDGRIVPTEPIDWPDGTTLAVEPMTTPAVPDTPNDLLGDDPDSIARWVSAFEALPSMEITDAEEADWRAAREEARARSTAGLRGRAIDEDRPGDDRP